MENPRVAIARLLAERGYRLTGPRRAVLGVLADAKGPVTVAEIHKRIRARGADLVSVYRAIHLLVKMRLARAVDAARGGFRYELGEQFRGHHHHLICDACGKVEELPDCPIADEAMVRLNRRVQQSQRFSVTGHEVRLFGRCWACVR